MGKTRGIRGNALLIRAIRCVPVNLSLAIPSENAGTRIIPHSDIPRILGRRIPWRSMNNSCVVAAMALPGWNLDRRPCLATFATCKSKWPLAQPKDSQYALSGITRARQPHDLMTLSGDFASASTVHVTAVDVNAVKFTLAGFVN